MICKWCGNWFGQYNRNIGCCSFSCFVLYEKYDNFYKGNCIILDDEDKELLDLYEYFPIRDGSGFSFVREYIDFIDGWKLSRLNRDIKSRELGRELMKEEYVYRKDRKNLLNYKRDNFYIRNMNKDIHINISYIDSNISKNKYVTYIYKKNFIEIHWKLHPDKIGYIDLLDKDISNEYKLTCSTREGGRTSYIRIKDKNHSKYGIGIHRYIMERIIGRKLQASEIVDHIDHNGLNNRRSNLRIATPEQNLWNSKKYNTRGNSKYKGVFQIEKMKWMSKLSYKGEHIIIGIFDTEIKAATAYNIGSIKYFGEFACLNCY